MKKLLVIVTFLTASFLVSCGTKSGKKNQKEKELHVEFVKHEPEKKIDVLIGGKLFTSYRWPEKIFKPVLFPIFTASGTAITRGFPLEPKPGERADHRHQVGNWLNYGNVNGNDFWGNGHTGERSPNGGEIKLVGVEKIIAGNGEGTLITNGSWVDSTGIELLSEKTEYHFIAKGKIRIIDRITTLTATNKPVSFKDTKEGMFAIRVARQLELPAKGSITVLDDQCNPIKIKETTNEGVSGNYRSSEGVTGLSVWGTRAKWMELYGNIGNEKISLVICDHPKNISYPTYWHARGYGLFSANPLGVKDFTKGKKELNFSLPASQSVTFRYRIIISSAFYLTDDEINTFAEDFAKKY